jgi:hypothetical protein
MRKGPLWRGGVFVAWVASVACGGSVGVPPSQDAEGERRLTALEAERASIDVAGVPLGAYRGFYYDDSDPRASRLIAERSDTAIAFDWGAGAPLAGAPVDQFSVYWVGRQSFAGGLYRLHTVSDDGLRVYVDGLPLIDAFVDRAPTTNAAEEYIPAGDHLVQVLYYEAFGGAVVSVDFELLTADPMPAAPPVPESRPGFRNLPLAPTDGVVEVAFDAMATADAINSCTGPSLGEASAWEDLVASFRFNPSGTLDARDGEGGAGYRSLVEVPYRAGERFRVRMIIDFDAATYDVFVTPAGRVEVLLADDFRFPPQQSGTHALDNLGTWSTDFTHQISDVRVGQLRPPRPSSGNDGGTVSPHYAPLTIPNGANIIYIASQSDFGRASNPPTGSYVLFKRGLTFTGEVRGSSGVTYGAYGDGPRPIITGGFYGFDLRDRSNVVVRDVDIHATQGSGVRLQNGSNLVVYNVHISDVGSDPEISGVLGHGVDNVRIEHITLERAYGDGIGIWGGTNLKILRNVVMPVSGQHADPVHLGLSSGVEVRGNWLEHGGTDSGKGALCLCSTDDGVVEGNVLIGGTYGVGSGASNILIENNWLENNNAASWSYGLGWGGDEAAQHSGYTARYNVIIGSRTGVAAFYNSGWGSKSDMNIYGNTFVGTETLFGTWGASFSNAAFHDNTLFRTPSNGFVDGIDVYGNETVGAEPVLNRPTREGRGAF